MSTAIVPHGGGVARGRAVPVYQIDFTAVASGKHFASSKRRVRWRFGFANMEALDAGETGTACRGEEHDVTLVWSVTSGKRLILADGHEVHYSNIRGQQFEFSWTMKGNHVLKVIAYAAPPINPVPNFRQYDFFVDGQSFFTMPKVYRLGLSSNAPGSGNGQGPPPAAAHRSPTYNNYTLTESRPDENNIVNLEAPQNKDEEEAFLRRALEESLQDAKPALSAGSTPAPAPTTTDLLDFADSSPPPTAAPVQNGYAAPVARPLATEPWAEQSWGQQGFSDALVPNQNQSATQYQVPGPLPYQGGYESDFQNQSYASVPGTAPTPQKYGYEASFYSQGETTSRMSFTQPPPAAPTMPQGYDSGFYQNQSYSKTAPPAFAPAPRETDFAFAYQESTTISQAPLASPVPNHTASSVPNVFATGYATEQKEEPSLSSFKTADEAYNKYKFGDFSLNDKPAANPFDVSQAQLKPLSDMQKKKTEKKPVMNVAPGSMVVASTQGGNWGNALGSTVGYGMPQPGMNNYGVAGYAQQPQYGQHPIGMPHQQQFGGMQPPQPQYGQPPQYGGIQQPQYGQPQPQFGHQQQTPLGQPPQFGQPQQQAYGQYTNRY